ncbi:cytochrome P450 [Aurantimonas sp. VKM B-3413]|uniref:cytochrome P450 n=1 Tax=Aurantimonas sp. VKM B-3413 TaxID=2779401 RepID=UPI001E413FE0|nr:cytochrome P450 [Aurantimonas sp. VKM B-3413]MCB8840011.1 cytochrome P450 [Aurantimonas sp. VKM B-3413]
MADIPRDPAIDSSIAFKSEGYSFVSNRCRELDTDIFATRLFGEEFYCLRGAEAAKMFYEPDRFTRNGALPDFVLHLLQDEGSVATLDTEAHRHRKTMFMAMMTPERLADIARLSAEELTERLKTLRGQGAVRLHDEFRIVLGRAVCRWAGVELEPDELSTLIDEMGAMIANAGSIGPSNWIARARRHHSEALMRKVVEEVRAGFRKPPQDSATHVIAWHRDLDGEPLDLDICAVEMLNILRPTVAVARFMTFTMLALHDHPEARARLEGDDAFLEAFVQEVRRTTPFFPGVAGIAREPFSWRGHGFETGERFMLDLYGTTHDERSFPGAEAFRPERFLDWPGNAFTMIPQGGGEHVANHRCPGEWLTIAVMKAMLAVIVHKVDYDVPAQDLGVDLSEMPALPASGFVIEIKAVRD